MDRKISYMEYRRRIFNEAVLTVLVEAHSRPGPCKALEPLNGDAAPENESGCSDSIGAKAAAMAHKFFNDELDLENSTVGTTKKKLSEACTFLKEAADECEEIADAKSEIAQKEGMDIYDSQKPELSEEDKAVIHQLFDLKGPQPQINAVRDATVKALMTEEKKAQAIKDAYDIAKSQEIAKKDDGVLEETVKRIQAVGPTSLMNSIMNSVSVSAVKSVNESGHFVDVGTVLKENSEEIKGTAAALYSLFEMAQALGITHYTNEDVKALTTKIFYEN